MKLSFDTGLEFRPAMETLLTMGLGDEHGGQTPACRLVLEAGAKSLQVLALRPDYALRLHVPLTSAENEPGDTTLPAVAVLALCAAPLHAPLSIEAEGVTIVTLMGKRCQTFEALPQGPEARTCERIIDGDRRNTSIVLDARTIAERLNNIDDLAETLRISVGADGMRAWWGNDDHADREADTVLSDTPGTGAPATFAIKRTLLANALRSLRSSTVTMRATGRRAASIAVESGANQIVLAPALGH